jgi:hypothetical protein
MLPDAPFKKGLKNLLTVEWTLSLVTPLCIKNGHASAFKSSAGDSKSRYDQVQFSWNMDAREGIVDVQDFVFDIRVTENGVQPLYLLPASSIRGAFRSWTLKRLIRNEKHRNLLNIEENDQEGGERLLAAVSEDNGLALAADLFGAAARKNTGERNPLSRSGRLRVEVGDILNERREKPWVQGNHWQSSGNRFGPANAARHISVRGPVDRFTHAAREGGVHHFLELSPEQTFKVRLKIVNPDSHHLGLVHIWGREIHDGMLRIGGLSAIGRGRLDLKKDDAVYRLYALPQNPPEWLSDTHAEMENRTDDPLAFLWKCHRVIPGEFHVNALKAYLDTPRNIPDNIKERSVL